MRPIPHRGTLTPRLTTVPKLWIGQMGYDESLPREYDARASPGNRIHCLRSSMESMWLKLAPCPTRSWGW